MTKGFPKITAFPNHAQKILKQRQVAGMIFEVNHGKEAAGELALKYRNDCKQGPLTDFKPSERLHLILK